KQREETADIGCGVEEIRVVRVTVARADEPCLQERVIGGEREERQAYGNGKQAEQPERCGGGAGRVAPALMYGQRQRQGRREQKSEMHCNRRITVTQGRQRMRVGVTGEKHRLKEN